MGSQRELELENGALGGGGFFGIRGPFWGVMAFSILLERTCISYICMYTSLSLCIYIYIYTPPYIFTKLYRQMCFIFICSFMSCQYFHWHVHIYVRLGLHARASSLSPPMLATACLQNHSQTPKGSLPWDKHSAPRRICPALAAPQSHAPRSTVGIMSLT